MKGTSKFTFDREKGTHKKKKCILNKKVHLLIKSQVTSHVLKENPTLQRTIATSLNISVGIAKKITKFYLKLIKNMSIT